MRIMRIIEDFRIFENRYEENKEKKNKNTDCKKENTDDDNQKIKKKIVSAKKKNDKNEFNFFYSPALEKSKSCIIL